MLEMKVNKNGTETGFAIQECIQKVMKAQGLDHPLDAMQYLIEHLVAISASLSIPSVAIIESVMQAIAAGSSPEARGMIDNLFDEFQSKRGQKAH